VKLLDAYRSYFRRRILRDDSGFVTDLAVTFELPKFIVPAAVLALLGSFAAEPLRTVLMVLGAVIAVSGIGLLTFWWAEVKLRAADKRYEMFVRSTLSHEYREEDR